MFKRLMVILTLVISSLFVAPVAAEATVHCDRQLRRDGQAFNKPFWSNDVFVRGFVHYKFCWRGKGDSFRSWVKLSSYGGLYNTLNSSYRPCGWRDPFQGVRMNFYFWDRSGRNWNPRSFFIPCEQDTTNSKLKGAAHSPRLYVCGRVCTGFPRWKANVTIVWDNAENQHGTVGGRLNHR